MPFLCTSNQSVIDHVPRIPSVVVRTTIKIAARKRMGRARCQESTGSSSNSTSVGSSQNALANSLRKVGVRKVGEAPSFVLLLRFLIVPQKARQSRLILPNVNHGPMAQNVT